MIRIIKAIFKRRQMIVSTLQYRLIIGNFLYLVAVILVFVPAIFVPLIFTLDDTSAAAATRDAAAQQILALQGRFWIGVPLVFALCLTHALLVSHRVAGPLYRFNRILHNLREGDLSMSVRIRREDYLWDEARCMDEMVGALARKIEAIRDVYEEANSTLPTLIESLRRRDQHDAVVLSGKLGTQMDYLGRQIREFRLPPRDGVNSQPELPPVPQESRDSVPEATV